MKTLSLTEFLAENKDALFAATEASYPPRVPAPRPLRWKRGRKPLGAQAHAITALDVALHSERHAFLVAEMGTGKTFMAIHALLEHDPSGRFLVVCPPHLVEKWKREVEQEGARGVILKTPKDVERLKVMPAPFFAILSREKAKLGPGWRPGYARRVIQAVVDGETRPLTIPACPRCGAYARKADGTILDEDALAARRHTCIECGEPLWQEAPTPRRESLYHALRRILPKGFFTALVLDEAHEYKAAGSAQALVAAGLMSWIGKSLLLTGTLFGGYASTLYHLLKRTVPEIRERFPKESDFIRAYGLYEFITTKEVDGAAAEGVYTRRRNASRRAKERPGISPLALPWLLPRSVFLRLPDVASDLPPYGEEVRMIAMEREHEVRYQRFAYALRRRVAELLAAGDRRLLGALVQAGIQVPDTPWQEEAIEDAYFEPFPTEYRHAKEEVLLELVAEERRRRRRVLIYVQGTEKRDQLARLEGLLAGEGYRARALRSGRVAPDKRERWIKAELAKGLDALIVHPRAVQTGLDLVDFPTVVFYQPEYSVYTLRQAARRSWRVGQRRPVRVVFFAYRNTLQEAAIALIAAKARSALALEGELVEGGLTAAAVEDPTLALAKALAGERSLTWDGGVLLEPESATELELEPEVQAPWQPVPVWSPGREGERIPLFGEEAA